MTGPFAIIGGTSPYFSAPLMGNYNGNVIGSSNLAVQNIYSVPNPKIKCQVKQPFSATANENFSLIAINRQPDGIRIACERETKSLVESDKIKTFSAKEPHCGPCC